jgi:hypothetical protein
MNGFNSLGARPSAQVIGELEAQLAGVETVAASVPEVDAGQHVKGQTQIEEAGGDRVVEFSPAALERRRSEITSQIEAARTVGETVRRFMEKPLPGSPGHLATLPPPPVAQHSELPALPDSRGKNPLPALPGSEL